MPRSDVPHGTPIYAGPGERTDRTFINLLVRGAVDNMRAGQKPVGALPFNADPRGPVPLAGDTYHAHRGMGP